MKIHSKKAIKSILSHPQKRLIHSNQAKNLIYLIQNNTTKLQMMNHLAKERRENQYLAVRSSKCYHRQKHSLSPLLPHKAFLLLSNCAHCYRHIITSTTFGIICKRRSKGDNQRSTCPTWFKTLYFGWAQIKICSINLRESSSKEAVKAEIWAGVARF